MTFWRLQDILVNNATQTIRRPAAYYRHLLPAEKAGLAALEDSAGGNAGMMLKAHCQLHSNRGSAFDGARLTLPSSADAHNGATAAANTPKTAAAPGRDIATGSHRSGPNRIHISGDHAIY